jgi:hypothetical protein
MELSRPQRPRVARETRLLLSTAVLAVLALWILGRVRFPDQPAATTPLQPLLTQLRAGAAFDDLASQLAQLRPRLAPFFAGAALRIRPEAALLVADEPPPEVIAFDGASRLAVIRTPVDATPPPAPWRPSDLQQPRYLVAADSSAGALTLRPVLVGPLVPVESPLWREPVWLLPAGTDIASGSFLFTTDALLAGLAIDLAAGTAIVPAAVLLQDAERLLASGASTPGDFGIEVQALTPSIARATGATEGVVVAWVDPAGPAAEILTVGDVIEAVDQQPLDTPLHWTARAARALAGGTVMTRVWRGGKRLELGLIAAPRRPLAETAALGLTLRTAPGAGSLVVDVQAGSAGDRAGLRGGDVITTIGGTRAPSPAAVRRAFTRASAGGAVLVAYTRDGGHAVTALERR